MGEPCKNVRTTQDPQMSPAKPLNKYSPLPLGLYPSRLLEGAHSTKKLSQEAEAKSLNTGCWAAVKKSGKGKGASFTHAEEESEDLPNK